MRDLLALSRDETARTFRISKTTIDRWEAESTAAPEVGTVGSLVKPSPPVRRYADVLRHLVGSMALCGFGGNDLIARILARAGWKISSRTVARIRKEKPYPSPAAEESAVSRSVIARYPNHLWMADLTEIPGLFRLFSFKLAVVLDAFSRMPLAACVFRREPRARDLARLVENAATTYGTPRHFVSDQGTQFTAAAFRKTLGRLAVRHRFGAVGKTGSIALIERLWRTLKELLKLRQLPPLLARDLRDRLRLGLLYYACLRPHQNLGGATPAETYFRITPAHTGAVHPPRGRPGQRPRASPFQIRYLDPERRLPILVRSAA